MDTDLREQLQTTLSNAYILERELGDLQELRDHSVTPDFIASLRRFGFTGLTTDQLLEARDHGVTESFIEDFRDLGYTSYPSVS